uniref:Natriuretic peptide n=1 Tax=Naja naja TaxID=35670 RepID=A0A8C6X7E6_NAJNA
MPSVRHLQVPYIRRCERIRPDKRARLDERRSCSDSARLGFLRLGSLRLSGPRPRGFFCLFHLLLRSPGKMVGLSRLVGGGLLLVLALLPLALDGKPAPEALHKPPTGLRTSLAALRILEYLRPDSKQSRAARDRMVHPEQQVGGGGDSRPLQDETNKGKGSSCFGQRIDRIGSVSGMGCGRPVRPPPALPTAPAALRILEYLRPDSKRSRAARDRMLHPEQQVGGGGDSRPLQDETNEGKGSSCFGQKIDRIGSMSGMGCGTQGKPPPALPTAPAALRILEYLRPDSKRSRAARDQMVHPEQQVGGGGSGGSRVI